MKLVIHVDGATEEDRNRGVVAAQRVFDTGRASASDCAWSAFKRKDRRDAGHDGKDLSAEKLRQARLWDQAEHVGIQACCQRMGPAPHGAHLELRFGDLNKAHVRADRERRPWDAALRWSGL